ncbi:MAG: DinB family protein [Chloroflexi bacterium]|nr:DinB family protein [Chloroflexota bacterium]
MNFDYCLNQLTFNLSAIERLVAGVSAEQARWKPSPEDWSALEVLNHLLDEEREDFPARLRHLFSGAAGTWPPIAPGQWAVDRAYNQRDFGESLAGFLRERQRSLEWLRTLGAADWQVSYRHEPLAGLTAGDLLVSWAAHDVLHMRQLVELKRAYSLTQFAPYAPGYAGDW